MFLKKQSWIYKSWIRNNQKARGAYDPESTAYTIRKAIKLMVAINT